MNLQELKKWMKSNVCIEHSDSDIDSCDNRFYSKIYEVDGKFFKVECCNDGPCEKWGERGYVRGVYEPIPCHKESWLEYNYDWVSDVDND